MWRRRRRRTSPIRDPSQRTSRCASYLEKIAKRRSRTSSWTSAFVSMREEACARNKRLGPAHIGRTWQKDCSYDIQGPSERSEGHIDGTQESPRDVPMRIGRMRDGIGDVQRQAVEWYQPRAEDHCLGQAQLVRRSQEGRSREEDSAYEAGVSCRWR